MSDQLTTLSEEEREAAREFLTAGSMHHVDEATVQSLLTLASKLLATIDADTKQLDSLERAAMDALVLRRSLDTVLFVVKEILEEYTSDAMLAAVTRAGALTP